MAYNPNSRKPATREHLFEDSETGRAREAKFHRDMLALITRLLQTRPEAPSEPRN